jgi:hypothetical protein
MTKRQIFFSLDGALISDEITATRAEIMKIRGIESLTRIKDAPGRPGQRPFFYANLRDDANEESVRLKITANAALFWVDHISVCLLRHGF